MKKFILATMTLCVMLFSQCRKTDVSPLQTSSSLSGEMMEVTINASNGCGKGYIDGYDIKWNVGDKFYVVGSVDGLLGVVTAKAVSGTTAELKGWILRTVVVQDFHFYYVGSSSFGLDGEGKYHYSIEDQSGSLNGNDGVANRQQLLKGTKTNVAVGTQTFDGVDMYSMMSLVNLSFKLDDTPYTGMVTVTGCNAVADLDAKTGTLGTGASGTITIGGGTAVRCMALIAGDQTMTFTAEGGGFVTLATKTIEANHYYNQSSPFSVLMIAAEPPTVTTEDRCSSAYIYSVGGTVTVVDAQQCKYGVVYSETDDTPTIEEGCPNLEVGAEYLTAGSYDFTADLTGLVSGHTYYVRAYAIGVSGEKVYATEIKSFLCGDAPHAIPANWTDGASPRDFSVSATLRVRFSQGNLQWSSTGTHSIAPGGTAAGTWSLAAHQFDFLGNNGQGSASTTVTRDLFGWGTSGYHQMNPTEDIYNINYYPYSTSNENLEYATNMFGYGPSTNVTPEGPSDLTQSTGNINNSYYDWGVYNAISNGADTPNQWRTLTNAEWGYLFNTRSNASNLYGQGKVGRCIKGLIILPDDWTLPTGLTFTPGANDYSDNIYTYSDWAKMETNGAIFLPAAGRRNGTEVYSVESYGDYWSSTCLYSSSAYGLNFYENHIGSQTDNGRAFGFSVRLVQDAITTGNGSTDPYVEHDW